MNTSMLSKIVKKGGETVSSTVQAVTGGISGSGKVDDDFDADDFVKNAKEKQNLQLKGSPSKDAVTTNKLSCHSGFIVKKNEQGIWQRRFVCLVRTRSSIISTRKTLSILEA